MNTDHKLISFLINFPVPKRNPSVKRSVYKFKNADWVGLKQTLKCTPWDLCIVPKKVDEYLNNWTDMFLAAVDQHVKQMTTHG